MCDTADMHGFGQFAQVALSQKLVAEMGCLIRDVQSFVRQPFYRSSAAAATATGSRSLVSEAASKSRRCFIRGSQNRLM
jgi:hypothetical protein